ncbi:MAG: hypothetical protein IJ092_01165 [Atopobiaceae bacterium]|nr:hypothetical protein [Atopobiaceae bacterium]
MMRKLLSTPVATALLFVLAAGLIGFGGINAAAAAPRIISEWYGAEVVLTNIHTAIVENDVVVEGERTLLGKTFADANPSLTWSDENSRVEGFAPGVTYEEVLKAENVRHDSGTIPQYVRVTVYKSWTLAGTETKLPELDPSLIELNFVTGNGWTIDPAASTDERTVLYYSGIVDPTGRTSEFMDSIYISPEVATLMDANGNLIYQGAECHIKATVDAVQTHNAQDAMTGAWGRTN